MAVAIAKLWWTCGGALSDGVVAVVWWVWRWCSEGVAVVSQRCGGGVVEV